MSTEDLRARFLRDRVLTATPAQRVVMLYDRLALDLARTATGAGTTEIDHAVQIVVELRSSLDLEAGGPADNLAAIYGYLIHELLTIRGGDRNPLPKVVAIVDGLRQAWTQAAEQIGTAAPLPSGAWVS